MRPLFKIGKFLAPNKDIKKRIAKLEEKIKKEFGNASLKDRFLSYIVPFFAAWTMIRTRFDWFQQPKTIRVVYPDRRQFFTTD